MFRLKEKKKQKKDFEEITFEISSSKGLVADLQKERKLKR